MVDHVRPIDLHHDALVASGHLLERGGVVVDLAVEEVDGGFDDLAEALVMYLVHVKVRLRSKG